MEIKTPGHVLTPPTGTTGRRERTLPLEGERGGAPTLPLEGEADFARLLAEELGEVKRAAAQVETSGQLMQKARDELEQSARHLIRAHQFLDLAKKGTDRG